MKLFLKYHAEIDVKPFSQGCKEALVKFFEAYMKFSESIGDNPHIFNLPTIKYKNTSILLHIKNMWVLSKLY